MKSTQQVRRASSLRVQVPEPLALRVQPQERHRNHQSHLQVRPRAKGPQAQKERMNLSILQLSFCELAQVLNHQE